jgi:uncharacterized protein YvpB
LRRDPRNDQALLGLLYLAQDGQASLDYLAQFLKLHPHHPQARAAIQWTRQRVPTSHPAPPVAARRPRRRDFRLALAALLAALLGILGLTWRRSQSQPVALTPAHLPPAPTPSSTQPYKQSVQLSIPLFTPTPAPTLPPAMTLTPLPDSALVPVVGQTQTRNLSCESRSATDLARYWNVKMGELEFLDALGQSDNPHRGFVGDVDMPPGSLPPYGYGVYAEPVSRVLRSYGLDARPVYDLGLDGLRAELLAGRPVLIWATYLMALYEPREWLSSDGQSSTVVPFMHTFLVTGFDPLGVFVLDAYDATVQYYSNAAFLDAWDLFDQMAVLVNGPLP